MVVQDCQKCTDESLKHVSQGLTQLKSINLSFCVSISDSGLKHLAKMPSLRELNLRSCDNVSDAGMAYLAEVRPFFLFFLVFSFSIFRLPKINETAGVPSRVPFCFEALENVTST